MTRSQLLRFLAIATVPAFALQALAIRDGPSGQPWLLATMWCPALAALVSSRASRELAWRALRRFRVRHALLGLAVGMLMPVLHDLVLWATGTGSWSAARFPLAPDHRGVAAVHHVRLLFGGGAQSLGVFACNLAASLVVGSVLVGLLAGLGEELGWRAVLQPEAVRRSGALRGTVFVGLFWAYWHLPVNLAGYNDPVHPVLTSLVLFPVGVVAIALLLGWLTQRTGSVWPAALAHGANNALSGALVLDPTGWAGDNIANLIAAILVAGLFGLLLARRARTGGPRRDEVAVAGQ